MISWDDGREIRYARGRCIDVAEGGIRVELPVAVPAMTPISLNAERIRISGSGRVRHTVRSGAKYLIGVELTQTLPASALAVLQDPQNLRAPVAV